MDIVECKKSYKEFKAELDAEMNRVANGFVRFDIIKLGLNSL